ncbi:2-isopropylmalate synthase protein [Rutstroemia sp. NJR-2017a BBW]|nr:2-isopropylmalate synthase protein [Rutstroemia sp. NJR-2017a BBW]
MPEPKRNGNIRGFFKPVPPSSKPSASQTPGTRSKSRQVVGSTSTSTADARTRARSSSPPVPSLSSNLVVAVPQFSPNISNGIVPGSDDEDDDDSSTCSLEDLSTAIWKTESQPPAKPSTLSVPAPSTPRASRSRKPPAPSFKLSPLAAKQSNFKFDLKSLVSAAADDDALEERTKRVKALMESPEDTEMTDAGGFGLSEAHGEILRNIKIDKDEGAGQRDAQKVLKAVQRTEATNTVQRWYFFETEPTSPLRKRQPFPKQSLPREWKDDLAEPQFRHQTFVSGFAENMITYGKQLPDEILLWILDEICVEELGELRNAYRGILKACPEQVRRLVTPETAKEMFVNLGATATATTLNERIRPHPEVSHCHEICTSLFQSVESASLRLQIVQCIPSTSPSTHELRRRLALSFYFNSPTKALHPPASIISLPEITTRLQDAPFKITSETDYHELGSLILLLDIAVDKGRSADLDLGDPDVDTQFNNEVDALALAITSISITYSGAAYISRIEAKEVVEMVGNRISNTVRSRLKPKYNIYDESLIGLRKKEDFGREQKGMSSFMEKLRRKNAVEVTVCEER